MDNFDFKHRNKKRGSVDGFILSGSKKKSAANAGDLSSFNRYYRPDLSKMGQPQQLTPRRSMDGFTPSTQAPVYNPSSKTKISEYRRPFEKEVQPKELENSIQLEKKTGKKRRGLLRRQRAKKPKQRSKFKLGLRIAGALSCIVLLLVGGLLFRGYLTGRGIFKGGGSSALLHNQEVDPSQLKGEGDGRVNVLVLGKGGEEQPDGPDLTDTIIVASIDPLAKEAALLSIPRDLWVKAPLGGSVKINQIYADAKSIALNKYPYKERDSNEAQDTSESAGIDALKKVVTETMGVPLHYYVMIDFAGFRKAIDTVGGIDINVTEDMAVRETMRLAGKGRYQLDVKAGQQHFDGWRALAFSRSRYTSGRGDFARADRQRAVILALKDKVLSAGTLANPVKLNQLISDFGGQLHTDFSINEMLRLYDLSKEISADKVASAGLSSEDYLRFDQATVGGKQLSVLIPKAGMYDYSEIQSYVRNVMRDAFLKKEDARIIILNGTKVPGLATKKATELKSFGYNVTTVDDAPTDDYEKTVLVNLSQGDSKKYTLNYLQKRLGVTATGSLPDPSIQATGADLVIILGTDTVQQ